MYNPIGWCLEALQHIPYFCLKVNVGASEEWSEFFYLACLHVSLYCCVDGHDDGA